RTAGASSALPQREALRAHRGETSRLPEALTPNRRARVGAFSARRLHRHVVEPPETELLARDAVMAAVRAGSIRGAALAGLLRRLDSSSAAFTQTAGGGLPDPPPLAPHHAKYQAPPALPQHTWHAAPETK